MLQTDITCQSGKIVYAVTCSSCNQDCTGEIGDGPSKTRGSGQVYRKHFQ